MFKCGQATPSFEHLRPQAPPQVGTPDAAPAENQGFSPGDPDFQPHPEIRDFVTGTPIYPVPYCPNTFLFRYNVKHERACLNPTYTH